MGKNDYSRRQERLINLISGVVLALAVVIVLMNITMSPDKPDSVEAANHEADIGADVTGQADGTKADDGSLIAGIAGGIPVAYVQGNASGTETDTTPEEPQTTEQEAGTSEETSGIPQDSTQAEEIPQDNEPDTSAVQVSSKEYNNVTSGRLQETVYVKSGYFDNTIFLGDSRTEALSRYGFIRPENTFAVIGINHVEYLTRQFTDSVTGITGDIFEIVAARRPERIYVALGVNGVAFIDRATFLNKYNELIDRLIQASPDSKIIMQCILPVNEYTYTGKNAALNNANIDAMNAELLKLAENKGVFYLDTAGDLKNDEGQLQPGYDSGDGLHFSLTGYSVVYDGICRHGVD